MTDVIHTQDQIHTRDAAKARARQIRAEHAAAGDRISHSAALEAAARELGYTSWNALSARLSNAPARPLQVGERVAGRYLKQPFEGRLLAVRERASGDAFDVTVEFDAPVDVVAFDSFSAFRHRVSATIAKSGVSFNKTRDGAPHLFLWRDEPAADD